MQGLRAFCGILESYKRKYLEKTQLHRLTAKVGLVRIDIAESFLTVSVWFKGHNNTQ